MKPQEHDIMRAVEDRYWWYQALRQHVADSIELGAAKLSVLDAGCGSGGMLAALRKKFPHAELTGIDESEHAIELCRARNMGARLFRAGVHDLPFPADAFDIVLSLDVWKGAHDEAVGGVRRYSRSQVRALLEASGFTINRLTYWNATLTPPIAVMRWLSRRRPASEEARSDFR